MSSTPAADSKPGAPATRIALVLFEEVDLLDVGGPYEVLLTANRLVQRGGDPPPFDLITASLDGKPVTAYGGLGLIPQAATGDVRDVDVVLVPGAVAIDRALEDGRLVGLVRAHSRAGGLVVSVCTGAFFIGAAGLLDGRPFTTHFEDLDALAQRVPAGNPLDSVRWVDDGDLITAGGLSSGIAMALHLVERLAGRPLAEATARQIDYDWTEQR